MDKDLYDLPPEELAGIPTVCASLREAMEELEKDMDFLLAGDVFTKDQIHGLHGPQVGRDLRVRAHAAPGRIQDVLQLLSFPRQSAERAPSGALSHSRDNTKKAGARPRSSIRPITVSASTARNTSMIGRWS
jgi:hypothetical protein